MLSLKQATHKICIIDFFLKGCNDDRGAQEGAGSVDALGKDEKEHGANCEGPADEIG